MIFKFKHKSISKELLENYHTLLNNRGLTHDFKQINLIAELEHIKNHLESNEVRFFKRRFLNKGLYIFGSVGTGKTFLMDLFYQNLAIKKKLRTHYHNFMDLIHSRRNQLKKDKKDYSLGSIAKELSSSYDIICLDEFQIYDVADAMILRQLFINLLKHRIYLITTSNIAPNELYIDGLHRELFEDFILLLKKEFQIYAIESKSDYRTNASVDLNRCYFFSSQNTNILYKKLLRDTLGDNSLDQITLNNKGHNISLASYYGTILVTNHDELLRSKYSASDYKIICNKFTVIFLEDLESMSKEQKNELKRLVNFIDFCYEKRVKLVISAKVDVKGIFPKKTMQRESNRTISRIRELCNC
jgi:cell division protein ZapE